MFHGRNTPTGVGKITWSPSRSNGLWKHPHGCGEDDSFPLRERDGEETPPRVWGRYSSRYSRKARSRNTPTGVGKMKNAGKQTDGPRKHPHGCGEDGLQSMYPRPVMETPPRVWGRFAKYSPLTFHIRNTPTGVGKIARFCIYFISTYLILRLSTVDDFYNMIKYARFVKEFISEFTNQ